MENKQRVRLNTEERNAARMHRASLCSTERLVVSRGTLSLGKLHDSINLMKYTVVVPTERANKFKFTQQLRQ